MADNAVVQEDTTLNNSKMLANKQPVFVDIGSVQSKNLKFVTFNPIGELIPLEENLTLRYRITKSFHPKSGDWIGLFQVSHGNAEKYLYIGFHWAQKHPYEKKKPLERMVHFRINEFNIPISCGKDTYYQFLYMTHSEKLVGCSNIFGIRICLPLVRKTNAASETSSAVTQTAITCHQQKAIVPYEFFHQQFAQLHLEDAVIHLCHEDLTASRCVIDPIKYPVTHRFAGSQGVKNWNGLSHHGWSSYLPSKHCTRCQQSKDIIRSLQKRIVMLRKPAKQCETKDCVCSQKEIDALKNEVKQLKQHVVSLEEALSEESSLKSDLIQINHQMEREMMRKLKAMTTWLMEKRASLCQNQHQYGVNYTSAGHNRKEQVHINQSVKPRFNIANPYVNLDNPSTNEMSESKKSPDAARNEEAKLQNVAGGFERTLHKKKVSLNHNTYSGSRIGLRYLFKENAPRKEQLPSADETYSGSNLSLRFLFGEPIPDKARMEQQQQQHTGSNHSLGRRFEERFYGRGQNKPTSSGNTYSGSNLALSYLFNEESEDAATNLTAIAENSGCAKCSCQCKAQAANERKDKDTTNTENLKLMKDNVDEGFKRKAEKSVQINSKKLSVYFQSDRDQQEVLRPNDVRTESNPETGSNYLVEIKDNFLVKVTEQTNRTSVSQDTKSAPVSDTTKTAAGVEGTKAPVAIAAKPKPEPRKKSKRSPAINNSVPLTTTHSSEDKKDAVIQVDGLLYSGGVYWVSSELPGPAKTGTAVSSTSYQATTTGVIPPTKSLTVSAVAATDGKQDMSKDSAILTTQTDISRDAKSAYSLGKTGVNSRGNETSIASNPTITSTNCRPAANKNLVTGSGAQGTSRTPTMVGTIQSIEMTDISSLSQLTVIKDVNIISIPTSTDAATAQPLHTLEKVDLDATTMTPLAILGPEENKKRKRCSATGSSALSKPKNADDSASAAMPTKNKIAKNACLASGSEFSNFIYTVKQRLPKSPTVPDDLARSSTQPVKAQSPPVTTTSHCTTGATGTKSESKTLPLMSVHSTGTGSTISATQRTKVLPPPSCPLLPPPNQARLQPAFKADTNDEYPPLPSTGPNVVEIKPSSDKDDTSYASVTRRDKKPVNRPDAAMCSLHSLAKLAKNIILKYYKPGEEMNESHVKAAIETGISTLAQNKQDSQKQTTEKTSQNNQQESVEDTVESARLGNTQNTEDLSAAKQEVCLKTATLSTIIREAPLEENNTTTERSLAINQTPANKEPIKNHLSAAVQTDTDSLQTSLTVAAQDSVKLNTISTNEQESIKTEDAKAKRRDIKKKVTIKTGQKDSAEKDPAPNRKQRSMKADPNPSTKQRNVSTGPTGTESAKTTPVQSVLQREISHEEPLVTDLNTATMIDSPTVDPVHTTTPQSPPSTDPHPARDSHDSPKTDQSSHAAVQKAKKIKQAPTKRQDNNQKSTTKTNPNATAQPDPPDTRSRLSKHVANMQQQQQDDQSKHT